MQPNHVPRGDPCVCGVAADKHRISHTPKDVIDGICGLCGLPVIRHYVKHIPRGEPCDCGVPFENHHKRTRSLRDILRANTSKIYYIGLDGEGQGKIDYKYVLLCASDESGRIQRNIQNPNGLSTVECFEFILSLPTHARAFAYSFNYDLTKMLKDLPDDKLYLLNS